MHSTVILPRCKIAKKSGSLPKSKIILCLVLLLTTTVVLAQGTSPSNTVNPNDANQSAASLADAAIVAQQKADDAATDFAAVLAQSSSTGDALSQQKADAAALVQQTSDAAIVAKQKADAAALAESDAAAATAILAKQQADAATEAYNAILAKQQADAANATLAQELALAKQLQDDAVLAQQKADDAAAAAALAQQNENSTSPGEPLENLENSSEEIAEKINKDIGEDKVNTIAIIALVFALLLLGQFVKHISNWTGLPYTALITVSGVMVYFSPLHYTPSMSVLDSLDAHIILMVFIPALVFESAFNADWYIFKRQLGKILILAAPVLAVCVALTAVVMFYLLKIPFLEGTTGGFTWPQAILFGSIVSATDPIAVVSMLKELGASKRLATTIEGESLLNDGTAMVVFLVMLEIVEGLEPNVWTIIIKFLRLALGGPIIGWIFGVILTTWLARINKQPVLVANLTIVMSYICFFVAQHEYVDTSGILALVVLGLYTSHYGKPHIDTETQVAIHTIWNYIQFCAETLIFFLAGIIMTEKVGSFHFGLTDLYKTLILYIALHIIRFGVLAFCYPIFVKMGYQTTFNQIIFMAYAGLRGAIGITLCLILLKNDKIDAQFSDLVMFHVSCLVLLTLVINGTTVGLVVRALGLQTSSLIEKKNIVDFIGDFKVQKKTILDDMRKSMPYLRGVDWQRLETETLIPHFEKFFKKNKEIFSTNDSFVNEKGVKFSKLLSNHNAGKVQIPERDLLSNVRHQYLMMISARYQVNADAGLMYPQTLVLLEYITRTELDSCYTPINSATKMVSILNINSTSDKCWTAFIKCICPCNKRRLTWQHEFLIYDVLQNFLEINKIELALFQQKPTLKESKPDERFRLQVCREIQRQLMIADTILQQRFLSVQPELVVEANQRRAKYYLCTQQIHYTNKLVSTGVIREKHAKPILIDVRANITKLKFTRPKYRSIPFGNLLINSPLFEIFGEDTCIKLLKSKYHTNTILSSRKMIEPNENINQVYFVSRGSILETATDLTDAGQQTIIIDYEIGCCAGLQYLHPLFEGIARTTLSCQENHHAQVINFDMKMLQRILVKDLDVERRFWKHCVPRMIFLHQLDEFTIFKGHTLPQIISAINDAEYVNLSIQDEPKMFPHGGILLTGEFNELLHENEFEWVVPNKEKPYTLSSDRATVFVLRKPIVQMDSNSMMNYTQDLEVKTREERLAHLYMGAHTKALTPGEDVDVVVQNIPTKVKNSSVAPMNVPKKGSKGEERRGLLDQTAELASFENTGFSKDQELLSGTPKKKNDLFPPISSGKKGIVKASDLGATIESQQNYDQTTFALAEVNVKEESGASTTGVPE